jgi:hypothetical protein
MDTTKHQWPEVPPPDRLLHDELIELRLLRVLGSAEVSFRSPAAQFLVQAPELRFAIHQRSDSIRVGRIHLRLTNAAAIVESIGHTGRKWMSSIGAGATRLTPFA